MTSNHKYRQALDLALELTNQDDTDVKPADVRRWDNGDLYEWLEVGWDFQWDGEHWTKVEDAE